MIHHESLPSVRRTRRWALRAGSGRPQGIIYPDKVFPKAFGSDAHKGSRMAWHRREEAESISVAEAIRAALDWHGMCIDEGSHGNFRRARGPDGISTTLLPRTGVGEGGITRRLEPTPAWSIMSKRYEHCWTQATYRHSHGQTTVTW